MRTMITVMMAASLFAVAAAAEENNGLSQGVYGGHEVDTSYELTQARLYAEGYREIRMVNGSAYRLGAFDTEGSEVQLLISPQTGQIYETTYEHAMDE